MSALIEVKNLVKRYGSLQAVNGINLSIEEGTCFGLLGPNGAGKTTTIEILEGITEASEGELYYRGELMGEAFKAKAGIMFQSTALQEHITVFEALTLFRDFYPSGRPIEELVERCSLGEFLHRDTHKLSGGQRQRLLLAIALVNDPEMIFLDEPTTGLDPQSRRNLWQLVREIIAEGKTVLLTTHYMEEAYQLCDQIVIMDHGSIIAEGSPRELLTSHFGEVVLELPLELKSEVEALDLPLLTCEDRVELLSHDVDESIARLQQNGIPLKALKIRDRTLDDLFLELTGKGLRP